MEVGPEGGEEGPVVPGASRRGRRVAFEPEEGDEEEGPTEDVGARQPVNVGCGEHGRGQRASDQEVGAQLPLELKPEPGACGDRDGVEPGDGAKTAEAVGGAHEDIRGPFPGDPSGGGFAERVGVEAGEGERIEDALAGADVPARIGVAKEPVRTIEEEEDVDERKECRRRRKVGQAPTPPGGFHRDGQDEAPRLLAGGSDAGQTVSDALVEADDGLGQGVDGGDEGQADGRHDEGVFDQVLTAFVAPDAEQQMFHEDSLPFFSWPWAALIAGRPAWGWFSPGFR